MALASTLITAGTGIRRLTQSTTQFARAAARTTDTLAASAMVPSIFRRETPADLASLKLQIEQTGIAAHLFMATGAQAAALPSEIARTEQQLRPLSRITEADRASLHLQQEITEQQMRPFRR